MTVCGLQADGGPGLKILGKGEKDTLSSSDNRYTVPVCQGSESTNNSGNNLESSKCAWLHYG